MKRLLLVVLALAALGVGGFRVFEHYDQAGVKKAAGRACGTLDTPTGGTSPVRVLPGATLLSTDRQGTTQIVFASSAGDLDTVVQVRDSVVSDLLAQGYTLSQQDQEKGVEAEAELAGPADVTVKVKPLCTGRLSIRYTVRA